MKTNANHGSGVVSYDILDLTPAEMDTMLEARETLRANLINHQPGSEQKKEYLSDEQLIDIFCILVRLTEGANLRPTNSFKTVDLFKELDPEWLHCAK